MSSTGFLASYQYLDSYSVVLAALEGIIKCIPSLERQFIQLATLLFTKIIIMGLFDFFKNKAADTRYDAVSDMISFGLEWREKYLANYAIKNNSGTRIESLIILYPYPASCL